MTGLGKFQPGAELACASCEFRCAGRFDEPACQVALEVEMSGEPVSVSRCPRSSFPIPVTIDAFAALAGYRRTA